MSNSHPRIQPVLQLALLGHSAKARRLIQFNWFLSDAEHWRDPALDIVWSSHRRKRGLQTPLKEQNCWHRWLSHTESGPTTFNSSFCYIFQLFFSAKNSWEGIKRNSPWAWILLNCGSICFRGEKDLNVELNFLKVNSQSWALEGCRSLCFVLRLSWAINTIGFSLKSGSTLILAALSRSLPPKVTSVAPAASSRLCFQGDDS